MQAIRKKTIYNNDAVRLTRCVTIIYNYTDSESYLLSNTQMLIIQKAGHFNLKVFVNCLQLLHYHKITNKVHQLFAIVWQSIY